MSTNQTLTGN